MAFARLVGGLAFLILGVTSSLAQGARQSQYFRDRLTSGGDMVFGRDKAWRNISSAADAVVRMDPSFALGYVVGITHNGAIWQLVGRGNPGNRRDPTSVREVGCSRPVDEKVGRKILALWGKALSSKGETGQAGLDGETFTFSLKGQRAAGYVWSPDPRYQPKMYRLAQVSDGMFAACITGKGLDVINRQIDALLRTM